MIGKVGLGGNNLLGLYLFNNNIDDTSGNDNDLSGTVDSYPDGKIGKAAKIVNQATYAPKISGHFLDPELPWSVSCLFKIESIGTANANLINITTKIAMSGVILGYNPSTPKLTLTVPGSGGNVTTIYLTAPLTLNHWYFLTLSKLGYVIWLYLDGQKMGEVGENVAGVSELFQIGYYATMTSYWSRLVVRTKEMTITDHQRMFAYLKYGISGDP
jgi:hypothetical protein